MTSREWSERLGMYDMRENAHEDFWTFCPCHRDTRPTMHVFRTISGQIAMKCHTCGASGEHVCRELGIPERELRGEPMIRRRRRRQAAQQEAREEDEGLCCMACGGAMRIDVWPDVLGGGWIAQGRCVSDGGCGMWITRTVRGESERDAAARLKREARASWRRAQDWESEFEGVRYPDVRPAGRRMFP